MVAPMVSALSQTLALAPLPTSCVQSFARLAAFSFVIARAAKN